MKIKIRHIILSGICAFAACNASAQKNSTIVKFANPSSLAAPKGYSHVAVIDLGTSRMLLLSGQVPIDLNGKVVGEGNMAKQTQQVFQNIANILTEFGGTMEHVVKLGYYVTDVKQIQKVRDVRDTFINTNNPPASTLVEVSHLFRDDVMIEVEATVVIPKVE